MFSDSTRQRFPKSHWVLLQNLEQIVEALQSNSASSYAFSLSPDPVINFNASIDFAIAVYFDKFKQLYQCVVTSIEQEWYLVYAQAGRSILENAATLRYYARHEDFAKLRHAWQTDSMDDTVMRNAALTLDKFIRGSRFSWDAFLGGRFDQLSKKPEQEHLSQVSVLTCLQKWYRDSPKLESLYDLMCDLVHPNIGSTFLVVRAQNGQLVAGGEGGDNQALFIVAPTLAGIVAAYKEIQNTLIALDESKLTGGA
jgi:hypothetical protein